MLKTDPFNFSCIKLIDQNLNDQKPDQYTYQTMVIIAGTCRFNIDQQGGYVQVVSAVLRRKLIF